MNVRSVLGAILGLSLTNPAFAQDEPAGPVEEVVVIGRLIDSAQALIEERLDDEVVSDVLDAESIARLGDSTVAASLGRISGLSVCSFYLSLTVCKVWLVGVFI